MACCHNALYFARRAVRARVPTRASALRWRTPRRIPVLFVADNACRPSTCRYIHLAHTHACHTLPWRHICHASAYAATGKFCVVDVFRNSDRENDQMMGGDTDIFAAHSALRHTVANLCNALSINRGAHPARCEGKSASNIGARYRRASRTIGDYRNLPTHRIGIGTRVRAVTKVLRAWRMTRRALQNRIGRAATAAPAPRLRNASQNAHRSHASSLHARAKQHQRTFPAGAAGQNAARAH